MSDVSLLIGIFLLLMLSAFFSAAEASVLAANRIRLRHLAKQQHTASIRLLEMLKNPEQLISCILIGSTFANILASSMMTIVAMQWNSDTLVAASSFILGLTILIFAEIMPKTVAVVFPERLAFAFSLPLKILIRFLTPIIMMSSIISRTLLKLTGINVNHNESIISRDELKSLVQEGKDILQEEHRDMLLRIFELENINVAEVMRPLDSMMAVNLADDWEDTLKELKSAKHSRIPLYRGTPDNIEGIFYLRENWHLIAENRLTQDDLQRLSEIPYFIPEATKLTHQMLHFRERSQRMGFVVDEYGRVLGMLTLTDILDEVVGEFTTNLRWQLKTAINRQEDGSVILEGSISLRDLNRHLHTTFNLTGPKTLSGLIIEFLEEIPSAGTCIKIQNVKIEILQVKDNAIKTLKIYAFSDTNIV